MILPKFWNDDYKTLDYITDYVTPSETPPNVASQNGIYSDAPGYQYNHPSDTGWPDWASMLGHTGYQEMSKIKLWG